MQGVNAERVRNRFCREYRAMLLAVENALSSACPDPHQAANRLLTELMTQRFLALPESLSVETVRQLVPHTCREAVAGLFARWPFRLSEQAEETLDVAVDPEIFGAIYEGQRGNRSAGAYYTPRSIVRFMCREVLRLYLVAVWDTDVTPGLAADHRTEDVDRAVAALVNGREARHLSLERRIAAIAALRDLRIIDPACGSGAFLVGMYDELSALLELLAVEHAPSAGSADLLHIVSRCLYGTDIDAGALEVARLRLQLALTAKSADAARAGLPDAATNLACCDSLFPEHGAGRADGSVPEWVRQQGRFDMVLTNPPYLSTKRGFVRDQGRRSSGDAVNYQTARGQYDAYALFIERTFTLLRPGGCYAHIVPQRLLTNHNMAPIRKIIHGNALDVIADPGIVFAAAVEPVILVGQKGPPKSGDIRVYDRRCFKGESPGPERISRHRMVTPAGTWNPFAADAATSSVSEHSIFQRLGELYLIARGVECGKKDRRMGRVAADGCVRMLRGQDVDRYRIDYDGWYFDRNGAERSLKPATLYRSPKLLVRRVYSGLSAACDLTDDHVLNTLYVLRPKAQEAPSIGYLCAVLNSRLMNGHFRAVYGSNDHLFPYIRQHQLAALPIALPQQQEAFEIEALVARLHAARSGAAPDATWCCGLQDRIESIVDSIYHRAPKRQ